MEEILILGMGGHANSVIDVIERENKYKIVGHVVNDNNCSDKNRKYPILGKDNELPHLFNEGIRYAAVGIGYLGKGQLRQHLYEELQNIGFQLPGICDPTSIIASNVVIGEGSFIGKGAIVNRNAIIGKMCIINTGAIIEHDCMVNDFTHISVGTVLCGGVVVGEGVFVGANATVIQGQILEPQCIVGAGMVIR